MATTKQADKDTLLQQLQGFIDDPQYAPANLKRGDIIEGTIVAMRKGMLIVDIKAKSEGIVAGKELQTQESDISMLKPGDKLLVYVLNPENDKGQIELSLKRTDVMRKWNRLEQAQKEGEVIPVSVLEANSGGVLVDVYKGLAGFIPTSQLDSTRLYSTGEMENRQELVQQIPVKLNQLIGQEILTKIIEIDKEKNRIILSEKLVVNAGDIQKREDTLRSIKIGSVLEGEVTGITPFGVFVNAQGVEGLVHLSEMSWNKVLDPSDLYKIGDKVKVQLIGLSDNGKRVAYSIKRLQDDPWGETISKYKVGEIVKGKIQKVVDYGAFVEIEEGLNGLIHISELSADLVEDPNKIVHPGDEVMVKILSISPVERHLGLSLKRAQQ